MILRDLVTRMTFKTDTSELRSLDSVLFKVKKNIVAIAGTALSGFMVSAGQSAALLKIQFDSLAAGGMEPLVKAMKKLRDPSDGLASIFNTREILEAGIAFKQLGFGAEEAALRLEQAALLSARANKPLGQIARELGTALQSGGMADYLLNLGLITRAETDFFHIREKLIAGGAGIVAETATREVRKKLADILEANRARLEADQLALEKSPAGAVRRTLGQLQNLWESLGQLITRVLMPVLNNVADLINDIWIETNRWKLEIEEAGGVWNLLFLKLKGFFPDFAKGIDVAKKALERIATAVKDAFNDPLVQGLFVGAFIIWLLGGGTKLLGIAAAGLFLKVIMEGEWKGVKNVLDKLLKTEIVIAMSIGAFVMFLFTKNPLLLLQAGLGAGALATIFKHEWGHLLKEMNKKLSPTMIAGLTIGGLAMALLTRNPRWLVAGALTGGLFAWLFEQNFPEGAEVTNRELPITRKGLKPSSVLKGESTLMETFLNMLAPTLGFYLPQLNRKLDAGGTISLPTGANPPGGNNIKIDIHVHGVTDPTKVGKIVRDTVGEVVEKVHRHILGQGQ